MKRITTIVLFAGIFAVAAGVIGLSGNSSTPLLIAATPQSPELVDMLGHVEYTLLDDAGNIKAYMQTDNIVIQDGSNCSADAIFGTDSGTCSVLSSFNYIGIGNAAPGDAPYVYITDRTLGDEDADDDTGGCASTGVGGDMARRLVTPSITAASGATSGAVVELITDNPFTFDASNATTVFDSGVFNANYATTNDQNTCSAVGVPGTDWSMFARQVLDTNVGITVSDGDSLSVKWTITIG